MKKNTLSLLETIKRKLKKIDDSDDKLDGGVDQEFEYVDGNQSEQKNQKTDKVDSEGDSIKEQDSNDIEDLKLEADIENSTSGNHSGDKKEGVSMDELEEGISTENKSSALESALEDDGDDFDLSFNNHEEDLEQEGGIDLSDIDSAIIDEDVDIEDSQNKDSPGERQDDFDDFEELSLDEDQEQEKNQEFLRGDDLELNESNDLGDLSNDETPVGEDAFDENLKPDPEGEDSSSDDLEMEIPEEDIADDDLETELPDEGSFDDKVEDLDINNSDSDNLSDDLEFELPDEVTPIDTSDDLDIDGSDPKSDDQDLNLQKDYDANDLSNIEDDSQISESQDVESSFQDELSDELDILDESHFSNEDQSENKSGFTAKSLTQIVEEERLEKQGESVDVESEDNAIEEESQADYEELLNFDNHDSEDFSKESESQNDEDQGQEVENFAESNDEFASVGLDGDLNESAENNVDNEENIALDKELSLDGPEIESSKNDDKADDLEFDQESSEDFLNYSVSSHDNSDQEIEDGQNNKSTAQQSDEDLMKELEIEDSSGNTQLSQEYTSKDIDEDLVINHEISSKVSDSIKSLQDTKKMVTKIEDYSKGDMLSHVAFELMKPKLEQWFNENLPKLVENVVREEIKKIISDNDK